MDAPLVAQPLHRLARRAPYADDPVPLILISAAAQPRRGQVVGSVSPPLVGLAPIVRLYVLGVVFLILLVPRKLGGVLAIQKDDVVGFPKRLRVAVRGGALPHDFVLEIVRAEDGVHQQLQIVARRRVAVEIDASAGLEDAVKLRHSLRHHREIRHHVVRAQKLAHRREQFAELLRTVGYDVLVGALRLQAPAPRVVERGDLRRRIRAAALAEQDVVGGFGVERRIEIDQVDAFVADALAQDVQIVPEVETVGGSFLHVSVQSSPRGRLGIPPSAPAEIYRRRHPPRAASA